MTDSSETRERLLDEIERLKAKIAKLEQHSADKKSLRKTFDDEDDYYKLIAQKTSDNIAVVSFDLKAKYLYVSPSVKRVTGYEPQDLIGRSFFDFIPPEDKKKLLTLLKSYLNKKVKKLLIGREEEVSEKLEFRFKTKSGGWRYMQAIVTQSGNKMVSVARDITEMKKNEDELKANEKKLRILLESSPIGIIHIDAQMCIQYENDEVKKILGVPLGAESIAMGMDLRKLASTIQTGLVNQLNKLQSGEKLNLEFPFTSIYGKSTFLKLNAAPLFKDNKFDGALLLLEDITERKNVFKKITESEHKFRTTFNQAVDSITIVEVTDDKGPVIRDVNDSTITALGYSRDELLGKPISFIDDEESKKKIPERAAAIMAGEHLVFDSVHVRKNGSTLPVEVSANLIYINDKPYIYSINRDITERKQAEGKLKQSRDYLNRSQKIGKFGDWQLDLATGKATCSENYYRLYGYEPGEFEPSYDNFRSHVHPDDSHIIDRGMQILREEKQPKNFEIRVIKKDGTEAWLNFTLFPEFKDGKMLSLSGTNQDITDRKQAELALKESESLFRTILYSIGDAVITTDIKGVIKFMNPAGEELSGLKESEVKNKQLKDVFEIVDEISKVKVDDYIDKVVGSGSVFNLANHTLLIQPDGRNIPIAAGGAPIKNNSGEITGVALVIRDQTEKRLNQRLIETRLKLREFADNNPLSDFLTKVLDEVCDFVGSPIGFYHFVEPDQNHLSLQQWSTRTKEEFCKAEGSGLHYEIEKAGVWIEAFKKRKPVIHNDYASLPNKKGMPEGHAEVVRELVVPVLRDDKVTAILGVGNKPNNYDQKDIDIVSYFADLTYSIVREKRAVIEIKESEEKYRDLIEKADIAILIDDKEGKIAYYNEKFTGLFGYSPEEIKSMSIKDIIHPGDVDNVMKHHNDRIKGIETISRYEFRGVKKDGSIIDLEVDTVPLIENDECTGTRSYLWDISDRKRSEILIKESEEQYRLLAETTRDIILLHDMEGRILYCNKAGLNFSGFTEEEALNKYIQDFLPEDQLKKLRERQSERLEGKFETKLYETEFIDKKGERIPVEVNSTPIVKAEKIESILIVARDISERKMQEEELVKLSVAVRQSPAAFIITNPDGGIEYVNPKFTEMTGYTYSEVLGENPRILKSDEKPAEEYEELWDTILAGKTWRGQFHNKKKNGELFWVSASISPLVNEFGDITHFIGVQEDINVQKNMQNELVIAKEKAESSDKMKSIFLAQMSHEIRTPLTVISNSVDLLKEETQDKISEEYSFIFDSIDSGTKRIIRTITLILNMADIQSGAYKGKPTDLELFEDIILSTYNEYRSTAASKGLELKISNDAVNTLIKADEYSVRNIASQLVDNAIKYTHKGTVSISALRDDEGRLCLEVSDTGIGMNKKYLENLFKPFTQEEEGYTRSFDGTGLGLALVKKYCELNNADISVESEKNVGTTFTVRF